MTRSKSLPVVVGVIRCGLKGGNEIALSRCAETRVERILKGPDCECSALRAHKKRVEVVALAHQLMANAREGTTMASHANAAKLCKSCSKPSPKGARLNRKGLCVKCRNDDDKGAKAAKRATPTQAAPEPPVGPLVCRVPTPAEQEAFAKEFPQFAAPVGSTRPKLRAVDRQLVAPAIVQADVNALRSANANLAAMVEHLKWAIASFVNGHLTKEELARKARIAGPASETEPQAVAS